MPGVHAARRERLAHAPASQEEYIWEQMAGEYNDRLDVYNTPLM